MKVLVTGGTGFVGQEIIRELLANGHQVRTLQRGKRPAGRQILPPAVEVATGDILEPELTPHLAGVDAVIHLVGIIREEPSQGITFDRLHVMATKNLLSAMKTARVSRLLHMSALGAGPSALTRYFQTKWAAESAVKDSGLAWTVFKPSVIFGPADQFVNMLAGQVRRLPLVPVIGDGQYRLQPVSVKDVAQGFVKALGMKETEGQTYEVGGREVFTYNELLDRIGEAVGKYPVRKIHLPLSLMRPLIRFGQNFSFFPITLDQLTMLVMSNVCEATPFFETFQLSPCFFTEGVREYLTP